jgi:hypothetical protein
VKVIMSLIVFLAILAGVAALGLKFYRRVIPHAPSEGIRLDWLVDTSAPHYREIVIGIDPNAPFKQRIEQRRLMRGYLFSLRQDFGKLTYTVKQLMVASPHDRPDLASILLRHSILFNILVIMVEWRLLVQVFGGRAQRTRLFVNFTVSVLVSVRDLARALTAQFLIEGVVA